MPKINTDFIRGVSEKDKDQEDPNGSQAILLRQVKAEIYEKRKGLEPDTGFVCDEQQRKKKLLSERVVLSYVSHCESYE